MASMPQSQDPDVFNFRCQYLLVEVGTKVLRQLFDKTVGTDFGSYLATNTKAANKLQFLMQKNIINADQARFLPPVDPNPFSSNFDISLLACLLRNVCGLRSAKNLVWIQPPQPNDLSVEADISRIRNYRNDLLHSGTVSMSMTTFNSKWNELTAVLNRLNNTCRISNLSTLINDAEHIDLDERLKEKYDDMIKHWNDMDTLFDHGIGEIISKVTILTNEQRGTKRVLQDVEQNLKNLKRPQVENLSIDILQDLINTYNRNFSTLQVSPMLKDDMKDIEEIYKYPTMCQVDYRRTERKEQKQIMKSYEDIFCDEGRSFQNIYVTGDAGSGKTSFCKHLCMLWCKALSKDEVVDERLKMDVQFMSRFRYVFYITLKETSKIDIIAMIVDHLFYTQSDVKWETMYGLVENILKENKCLVILDGFDEWTPNTNSNKSYEIPCRVHSDGCVYLTTCRPYKIENVRLSRKDIDHHVQLTGLHGSSLMQYVDDVVNHMNTETHENKKSDEFMFEIDECGLGDQLYKPMIASHLIVLWFGQKLAYMSRALVYANIVDMLFEKAGDSKIERPSSTTSRFELPDSLSEFVHLRNHVSLLHKLCLLSFRSLFELDAFAASLIFSSRQLMSEPYFLSPEEVDFLCKIGVLSKNKIFGCYANQKQKISFLHQSYIEFFAAFYVAHLDANASFNNVVNTLTSVNYVLKFENFLLILAGFSSHKVQSWFNATYPLISNDLPLSKQMTLFPFDMVEIPYRSSVLYRLQTVVVNCANESYRCNINDVHFKLEDFIFANSCYYDFHYDDDSNVQTLRKLLLSNKECVKSIHADNGKYLSEFGKINALQCLIIDRLLPVDYRKFTKCMIQNKTTLNTVCLEGSVTLSPLIPKLPVCSLQNLTSLSLSHFKMNHRSLLILVQFLSDQVLMENIKLNDVLCRKHSDISERTNNDTAAGVSTNIYRGDHVMNHDSDQVVSHESESDINHEGDISKNHVSDQDINEDIENGVNLKNDMTLIYGSDKIINEEVENVVNQDSDVFERHEFDDVSNQDINSAVDNTNNHVADSVILIDNDNAHIECDSIVYHESDVVVHYDSDDNVQQDNGLVIHIDSDCESVCCYDNDNIIDIDDGDSDILFDSDTEVKDESHNGVIQVDTDLNNMDCVVELSISSDDQDNDINRQEEIDSESQPNVNSVIHIDDNHDHIDCDNDNQQDIESDSQEDVESQLSPDNVIHIIDDNYDGDIDCQVNIDSVIEIDDNHCDIDNDIQVFDNHNNDIDNQKNDGAIHINNEDDVGIDDQNDVIGDTEQDVASIIHIDNELDKDIDNCHGAISNTQQDTNSVITVGNVNENQGDVDDSLIKIQKDNSQHIVKDSVVCQDIGIESDASQRYRSDNDCLLTLNLSNHSKLVTLCIQKVDILCDGVNSSSLKSVSLSPLSLRTAAFYDSFFNSIKNSKLQYVYIDNEGLEDHKDSLGLSCNNPDDVFTAAISALKCLKSLVLKYLTLPNDTVLKLHPDVKGVKIKLSYVKMSGEYFHTFIDGLINHTSVIKLQLLYCQIETVHNGYPRLLSWKETMLFMTQYISSKPSISIIGARDGYWLDIVFKSYH